MHDNGWTAGDVQQTGDDGYYEANIDLKGSAGTHYGAVVVYGANEKTAVKRRNFILRAIADHVDKTGALTTESLEQIATSCGIMKVVSTNYAPDAAIATWDSLVTFGKSVISSARTNLAKLRASLRMVIDSDQHLSDEELVEAVKALKEGRVPILEPTDAQVSEFITKFHAAANGSGSYYDNVKAALKSALSK